MIRLKHAIVYSKILKPIEIIILGFWFGVGTLQAKIPLAFFNDQIPIAIEADSATWDQNAQQAIYKGHVKLEQPPHQLYADEIILIKNKTSLQINSILAKGKPATFETEWKLKDNTTPTPISGKAQCISFNPNDQTLTLQGNAELIQAQNIFQGPKIIFNFTQQTITADAIGNQRPTIIYHPEQSSKI